MKLNYYQIVREPCNTLFVIIHSYIHDYTVDTECFYFITRVRIYKVKQSKEKNTLISITRKS